MGLYIESLQNQFCPKTVVIIIVSSLFVCPTDLRPVNLLVNSYQFFTIELSTSIGHKCVHTHTCLQFHARVCAHAHAHTHAHIYVSPLSFPLADLDSAVPLSPCSCAAENGTNSRILGSLDFSVICVSLLQRSSATYLDRPFPTGHSCFKIPRQRKLSLVPPLPDHHPCPLLKL